MYVMLDPPGVMPGKTHRQCRERKKATIPTPIVEHQENWWQLVQLAYVQLYLARDLAETLPHPWEKHLLKTTQSDIASPSMVLRAFERIISAIGTPAKVPKPRGKSPGRAKGAKSGPRKRHPVIKKAKPGQKLPAAA